MSTVTIDINSAKQKDLAGGLKKYIAYVITVRIETPVIVIGNAKSNNNDAHPLLQDDIRATNERKGRTKRVIVVEKRYSEFVAFHQLWKNKFPKIDPRVRNISLPAKKWFNNFSDSVIEERRLALDHYLKKLMHYPVLAREVYLFLGIHDFVPDLMSKKYDASDWESNEADYKMDGFQTIKKIDLRSKKQASEARLRRSMFGESKDGDISPIQARLEPHLNEISDNFYSKLIMINAIQAGNLELVQTMIENCVVDVNDKLGYIGNSPVMWAVHFNQIDIADYLIQQGGKCPPSSQKEVIPPIALELGIKAINDDDDDDDDRY